MATTTETNPPRAQDHPPNQPSETDQSRATGHQPPSGGTHPAATMSYANPQQGYPVPPHYQGYPQQGYHPYYADQSAAAAYYNTTSYSHADEAASSCMRCFCIIMFLLLILALLSSVIMFAVVRPEAAVFKVESLSVSNFNVVPATKMVSGKWDFLIFAENPSAYLRMYIDRWEASLYHKESFLASGSTLDSVSLDSRSKGTIRLKMETYNMTASGAAEDIEKEQKEGGNVSFGVRLTMLYSMRSGWWYHHYRTGTLRVKCSDLKVGLPVGANTGSMPNSKKCDITDG